MSEIITLIKVNFLNGFNSFKSQNNSQKIGSSVVAVVLGLLGIFLSWPIGWLFGMSISIFAYKQGRWKRLIGYN